MLTENDVVKYVKLYLENKGYKVNKALSTSEKGIDIEAVHPIKGNCFVEAKGETSSKITSNRFGKVFNRNQVKSHIGAALIKSFQTKQKFKGSYVCIALPDEKNHRDIIDSIKESLEETKIDIFFVQKTGEVIIY